MGFQCQGILARSPAAIGRPGRVAGPGRLHLTAAASSRARPSRNSRLHASASVNDDDWVEYEPEKPWIPGKHGPPQRTVSKSWRDALFTAEVSAEDMDYWFTVPPGMGRQRLVKM